MLTKKATWGILNVPENMCSKDTVDPIDRLDKRWFCLLMVMIKRNSQDPEDIVREAIRI